MTKTIAVICLIAVVGIVGAVVWIANSDTPVKAESGAGTASEYRSVPAGAAPVDMGMAVNQVTAEVTREAMAGPKEQWMTAAQVQAPIRTRID